MTRLSNLIRSVISAALLGLLAVASAPAKSAVQAPRLLYASDWSGPSQIYAVDPSRRAAPGQLTFGPAPSCLPGNPCGFVRPLAAPDGRHVLVWDHVLQGPLRERLFLAAADGSSRRLVAVAGSWNRRAAWAPDSRRIAYTDADGVHVVRTDGSGRVLVYAFSRPGHDRLAWSPTGRPLAVQHDEALAVVAGGIVSTVAGDVDSFDWSPTGKRLVYASCRYPDGGVYVVRPDGSGRRHLVDTSACGTLVSWSPAGRWVAFAGESVTVVDVVTGGVRTVGKARPYQGALAWSPNGRSVAFDDVDNGITIADARSGSTRVLSADHVRELTWSPDGGLLAYVGDRGLATATPAGRVTTLVPAAGDYGGVITDLSWTRAPTSTRYRPPVARSVATVTPSTLTAPWPIQRIAVDGERVAYVACGHVFVLTPAAGTVQQAEPQASLAPRCSSPTYYASINQGALALAGDRVVHFEFGGGIGRWWWLGGVELGATPTPFVLGDGMSTNGPVLYPTRGSLVSWPMGTGDFLVYSTWTELPAPGECCRARTTSQTILRVGPDGCPCEPIATSPGPLVPFDVDGGRVVAGGDNATVVYDEDGTELLYVPVPPLAAQLSGDDLVLLLPGELRHLDARTGSVLHVWPLPDVPSGAECGRVGCYGPRLVLEDLADGLVTYVVDGNVHLLRLTDGADAVVAPGTQAHFRDSGLVYVDGNSINFVRFDSLPLRVTRRSKDG